MAPKEASAASSARSSRRPNSDNVAQSSKPPIRRSSWKALCTGLQERKPASVETQRGEHIRESNTVDSSGPNTPDCREEAVGDMTPDRMLGRVEAQPYHWPHDASLGPENTALVIIDMQRDFCMEGGYMHAQGYDISPTRALIPRIQSLLSTFRAHSYPIYHTREGHRPDLSTLSPRELYRSRNNPAGFGIGDRGPMGRLLVRGEEGHDTIPELYPLPSEPVIDKPGRSAFAHTDFELLLRLRGVRNLVICGVTTDVCVASTMREANDRGFDCVLVEDATAAAEEELKGSVVQSIKEEGGIFGAVCAAEALLEGVRGG